MNIRSNKVFVGYNLRLNPLILFIKNYIKNKNIYSFNINTQSYLPNWRKNVNYSNSYSADKKKGGGVLLDLSHEIDIFLWFFKKITPKYFLNKKISNLNIKSDDYLLLIAKFKKNSYINLTQSYFSRKSIRNIFISGEKFSLEADLNKNSINLTNKNSNKILKYSTDILKTYYLLNLIRLMAFIPFYIGWYTINTRAELKICKQNLQDSGVFSDHPIKGTASYGDIQRVV